MAKMTLLEMTQNILSAMDSDAVNSISDTTESLQVAEAVVETYYELYSGLSSPSREGLIQLTPSSDPAQPNVMSIPGNVKDIKWIKYNNVFVEYMKPEDFFLNIPGERDYAVGPYMIYSDRDPTFWTTFDNNEIVFDGFNNEVDSSLQASKTLCWGQFDPVFELTDNAYPPYLNGDDFPGLLAEAKSVCFAYFKQVASSKDEQRSKRQRVRRQNDEWRLDQRKPYESGPDYGRKRFGRRVNFGH